MRNCSLAKSSQLSQTFEDVHLQEHWKSSGFGIHWKEKNLRSTIKDFKCPICGYDKAHLETRQTRRADEGMTHFITCLKCGKMKKIGS